MPSTLVVGPSETHTTIDAAVQAATNGDTIVVQAGTYPETVSDNGKTGLTIRADDPNTPPVIDGENTRSEGLIVGDDWVVENVSFRDITGAALSGKTGAPRQVALSDLRFENVGQAAVNVGGASGFAVLDGIQVYDPTGVALELEDKCLVSNVLVVRPGGSEAIALGLDSVLEFATVVDVSSGNVGIAAENDAGCEVRNSIVTAKSGAEGTIGLEVGANTTHKNNVVHGAFTDVAVGSPGQDLKDSSEVASSDHTSDPQFADPESDDFRIAPMSVARWAGAPAKLSARDLAGRRRGGEGRFSTTHLALDGTSQAVDIDLVVADALAGGVPDGLTFFFWFRTAQNTGTPTLIGLTESDGSPRVVIHLDGGQLRVSVGAATLGTSTTDFADDDWHSISVVIDINATRVLAYVDGNDEPELDATSAEVAAPEGTDFLRLGASFDGASHGSFLNGDLDGVAIWGARLTDSSAYELTDEDQPQDLRRFKLSQTALAWYSFEGDVLPTVSDSLGSNDGTVIASSTDVLTVNDNYQPTGFSVGAYEVDERHFVHIHGFVLDADDRPIDDFTVKFWFDEDDEEPIAEAGPKYPGHFGLSIQERYFRQPGRSGPSITLTLESGGSPLVTQDGSSVVWTPQTGQRPIVVRTTAAGSSSTSPSSAGLVLFSDGFPMTEASVRLSAVTLTGEVELSGPGAVALNQEGYFSVDIDTDGLRVNPAGRGLDLRLEVDAAEYDLGAFAVQLDDVDEHEFNETYPAGDYRGASTFEQVQTLVQAVLLELDDAVGTEEYFDSALITPTESAFIQRITGQGDADIRALGVTYECIDRVEVLNPDDAWWLFGLVSQTGLGYPNVLTLPEGRASSAIDRALDAGVAPASRAADIEDALEVLGRVAHLLAPSEGPDDGANDRQVAWLASSVSEGVRRAFLQAHRAAGGDALDTLDDLVTDPAFAPADLDALRLCFQVRRAVGPNYAVIAGTRAAVTEPADVAALLDSDWALILAAVDIPAWVEGATEQERRDAYQLELSTSAARLWPTTRYVRDLGIRNDAGEADLRQFHANMPQFEYGVQALDNAFFDANPGALAGVVDSVATKARLQANNRLFRLALPEFAEPFLFAVSQAGLTSAWQMTTARARAAMRLSLTDDQVESVVRHAIKRTAILESVRGQFRASPNPRSIADSAEELAADAGLKGMFDLPASYCACGACRSATGPVAYLWELYDFLAGLPAETTPPGHAGDIFFKRRPELFELPLSCDNADIPLPKIDLVLEKLEAGVIGDVAPANPPTPFVRSTSGSAELRRALPEHIRVAAYETVADAVYPWSLPFDLWVAEAQLYLQHVRTDLDDLLVVGDPSGPGYSDSARSRAFLELPVKAWNVLAGTTVVTELDVWKASTPPIAVVEVLKHSGLAFESLRDLTETHSFPGLTITVPAEADPCDISQMTLGGFSGNVPQRLHMFVKLARALDWPFEQLDRFASHYPAGTPFAGTGVFSESDIVLATVVERLRRRTGSSPTELLALWHPLTVHTGGSPEPSDKSLSTLYAQVYLNPSIVDRKGTSGVDLRQAFEAPGTGTPTLDELVPALQGALSIPADDLGHIMESKLAGMDRSLANLATLYRWAWLVRTTGITASELTTLTELASDYLGFADPFTDAETTLTLLDFVGNMARSEFTTEDLSHVLWDESLGGQMATERGGQVLAEVITVIHALTSPDRAGIEAPVGGAAEQSLRQRLVNTASSKLGVSTESTRILLEAFPLADRLLQELVETDDGLSFVASPSPWSPTSTPEEAAFTAWLLLRRAADFALRWGFTSEQLRWAIQHGQFVSIVAGAVLSGTELADWSALHAPPTSSPELFTAWYALAMVVDAWRRVGSGAECVIDVLESYTPSPLPGGWVPADEASAALAEALGITAGEVSAIVAAAGTNPSDTVHEDLGQFRRFVELFGWTRAVGADAASVGSWASAWASTTPSFGAEQVAEIRGFVRSRYTEEQWRDRTTGLRDRLREEQRDALLAWLVANGSPTFGTVPISTPADVSNYFSMDVEVSACQLTTRVRDAISAVQWFVQRTLLNFELDQDMASIEVGEAEGEEWKWRKQYRLWEANKRVLYFPENWLEPEFRRDRSPEFKALERELRQGDLTEDRAVKSVLSYLQSLCELGSLEVRAMTLERPGSQFNQAEVLHLVARTRTRPFRYYYRKRVRTEQQSTGVWTNWERLNVEVEGDHIVLQVHRNKVFVLWPVVSQRPAKTTYAPLSPKEFLAGQEPASPTPIGTMSDGEPLPDETLVDLAWVEREADGWSQLQRSSESLIIPVRDFDVTDSGAGVHADPTLQFDASDLYFVALPDEPGLAVWRPMQEPMFDILVVAGLLPTGRPPVQTSTLAWNDYRLFEVATTYSYKHLALRDSGLQWLSGEFSFPIAMGYRLAYSYNSSASYYSYTDHEHVAYLAAHPSGEQRNVRTVHPFDAILVPFPWRERLCAVDLAGMAALVSRRSGETRLESHHHPFAQDWWDDVRLNGLEVLYQRDRQRETREAPQWMIISPTVSVPEPFDRVDFAPTAAYGQYNWELFFHIPFTIAVRLMERGRYEEARSWFHRIYDPTAAQAPAPAELHPIFAADPAPALSPHRYWKFRPFFVSGKASDMATYLLTASGVLPAPTTPEEEQAAEAQAKVTADVAALIDIWTAHPFEPHRIARLRPQAYMRAVVMRYVDNLVLWGDELFRHGTMESVDEATQLYLAAADMLGPKPQMLTPAPQSSPPDYADSVSILDESAVELEDAVFEATPDSSGADGTVGDYAPSGLVPATPSAAPDAEAAAISGQGGSWCVPANDKLLELWDRVGDRLFKIRHCMTLDGQVRQLPLWAPPIDPGLVVGALALGADLSTAIADAMSAPSHPYRFDTLIRLARAACDECRQLGAGLVNALERRDAEALGRLNASYEGEVSARAVRLARLGLQQAKELLDAVSRRKEQVVNRGDYYRRRPYMNDAEYAQMTLMGLSGALTIASGVTQAVAAGVGVTPTVIGGAAGMAASPVALVMGGGASLAEGVGHAARVLQIAASVSDQAGRMAGMVGSYERRRDDWQFAARQAADELKQVDKEIAAAKVRVAMAKHEIEQQERRRVHAEQTETALKRRFSREELYDWMAGELRGLHRQSFNLAFKLARQAQAAYDFEVGAAGEGTFIAYSYYNEAADGLLAGDTLGVALRELEASYYEHNERGHELVKHVSLAATRPSAFMSIKDIGAASFDLDGVLDNYVGLSDRRIRRVSVTIPAVTGQYANVSCTLKLTVTSGQSPISSLLTMVTSTGVQDQAAHSGEDGRYRVFEGAGCDTSSWDLQLTQTANEFDVRTIADVILTVEYTAKGEPQLPSSVPSAGKRLISARHMLPTEWEVMKATGDLQFELGNEHFPAQFRGTTLKVSSVEVWAEGFSAAAIPGTLTIGASTGNLQVPLFTGTSRFSSATVSGLDPAANPVGVWAMNVDVDDLEQIENMWILVDYTP